MRILVAEDNPVNQEIMSVLLEETRAQLKMAGNGIEALALLEREAFDLMFLDIQMPDMDGYETIKIMRERGYVLPVVALTAHAMQSDKQRCLDAGMDAYLSKPFKQALLFDTIHSLLPEYYRVPEAQAESPARPSVPDAGIMGVSAPLLLARDRDPDRPVAAAVPLHPAKFRQKPRAGCRPLPPCRPHP